MCSLAEQTVTTKQQEQKVSELTEELMAAVLNRESLKKKHQNAEMEKERVRSELAQTQAE